MCISEEINKTIFKELLLCLQKSIFILFISQETSFIGHKNNILR